VSGRVFWQYTAPGDTAKPFLEFGFIGDAPSVNTPVGMFVRFEVFVLGEESNILAMDPIADAVITCLHDTQVTTPLGRTMIPEYRRDGRMDFWVEAERANIIRLQFWIPSDFWT